MNRALMVPAILCVVVGAALGGWGWGERDEARAEIALEADRSRDRVEDEGGFAFSDLSRYDGACTALYAAAALERPAAGPGMEIPGGPGDPDDPVPTVAPGGEAPFRSLVAVLDVSTVAGLPGLDEAEVIEAMTALRGALVQALDAGRDPGDDADVRAAADDLRRAVETRC